MYCQKQDLVIDGASCRYVCRFINRKLKVRLVAVGCRRIRGIYYEQTFSPVVSLTMTLTILAAASHIDLELEQEGFVSEACESPREARTTKQHYGRHDRG